MSLSFTSRRAVVDTPAGALRSAPAAAHPESGVALVMVMMSTFVLSVLGVALLLAAASETMMAAGFQRSVEARYAAEAVVARAASDAAATADWSAILSGVVRSSFVDGPSAGPRTLGDGASIDLGELMNLANCGRAGPCGSADLTAVTLSRPWGRNNPSWQPYGHGRLEDLTMVAGGGTPFYVVVMVADDPAENDDQPAVDGGAPATGEPRNAGTDVLVLRGEAFGPRGAYARVEATLVRGAGLVSWRLPR